MRRSKITIKVGEPSVRSRFEQRTITGATAWKVNSAGRVFKHRKEQMPTKNIAGLPTVDFGECKRIRCAPHYVSPYTGPVPPAGSHTTEDGRPRRVERLLDELVCFEWHGMPPRGFRGAYVRHLDDDENNCAANNLEWAYDEEFVQVARERRTQQHMRPDNLPKYVPLRTEQGRHTRPLFVAGVAYIDWQPTQTSKGGSQCAISDSDTN